MHIDRTQGSTAGNTEVTIRNGQWDDETIRFTTVMFGDCRAVTVEGTGETEDECGNCIYNGISATSPPQPAGRVPVKVTVPGRDEESAEEEFEYYFKIDSVEPKSGKIADVKNGNVIVSIKGDDLANVEMVQFDDKRAQWGVISACQIWTLVPDPGAISKDLPVPVKVRTAHGEDASKTFTYIA